ncbi:ABC transporter permease subunit [Mycoplasmopsis opalescens]|uniref:ABC transporter permease subunit n=1 Tax=Mycoplasmopsis opalescens TaxID=114886 RepID=UPI0004A75887|nr:ABC transporter permease [Mycoplasmopsis opalescens]
MLKRIIIKLSLIILLAFFSLMLIFAVLYSKNSLPIGYKDNASAHEINTIGIEIYHYDKPLIIRFFLYLKGLFTGNLGEIYRKQQLQDTSVYDAVITNNIHTYSIGLISLFLSLFVGYSLGIWAGYKRRKITDLFINLFVTLWVSISIVVLFPLILSILIKFDLYKRFNEDKRYAYVIGVTILTLVNLISYTQLTRNKVSQILSTDYILVAKSTGMNPSKLFFKYVFKNSLPPILSLLPFSLSGILTSSVMLENFLDIPGSWSNISKYLISGDNFVIIFACVVLIGVFCITSLVAEIIYILITPQLNLKTNVFIKNMFVAKTSRLQALMQQKNKIYEVKNG